MKKVLAAGRLSLKVGVSRPLSTENSSEWSMMAFACKSVGGRGGVKFLCVQKTRMYVIDIA